MPEAAWDYFSILKKKVEKLPSEFVIVVHGVLLFFLLITLGSFAKIGYQVYDRTLTFVENMAK